MSAGPHEFHIQGKGKNETKEFVEFASVRTLVSTALANLPVPPRPMFTRFGLAVTEKAPFALTFKFDEANATPGKPANVTVTATRTAGFTAEIALTATGLPANVTPMLKNIPGNMYEVKVQFNVAANAAPSSSSITIVGKAKHQNRDFTVNAPAVPLVIKK